MKKILIVILFILFSSIQLLAFVSGGIKIADDLYRAVKASNKVNLSKVHFLENLIKNPHLYKTEFDLLSHKQKVDFLSEIAYQKNLIKKTEQLFYSNKFNKIENGEQVLLKLIQRNIRIEKKHLLYNSTFTKKEMNNIIEKKFAKSIINAGRLPSGKGEVISLAAKKSPTGPGYYKMYFNGKLVYAGKAVDKARGLRKRMLEYNRGKIHNEQIAKNKDRIKIVYHKSKNRDEAECAEALLIEKYQLVTNGWNKRSERSALKKCI